MLAPDRRPHRTSDGHICILPYTDRHWRDFFRIAGRPELADDPRLADAQTRSRHVAELYALIADCVRDAPTAYWLDKLKLADIPSGPVNRLAELPVDEHLAAVDMFPEVEHPTEGSIRIVRPPSITRPASVTSRSTHDQRAVGSPGRWRPSAPRQ